MMNAQIAKQVHEEINSVMKQLAEKYGLEFKPSNAKYNESHFKTTLELVDRTENARIVNIMSKIKIGHKFIKNNVNYEVIDYRPRNYKMPYIIKNMVTQTTHKCTEQFINNSN